MLRTSANRGVGRSSSSAGSLAMVTGAHMAASEFSKDAERETTCFSHARKKNNRPKSPPG